MILMTLFLRRKTALLRHQIWDEHKCGTLTESIKLLLHIFHIINS